MSLRSIVVLFLVLFSLLASFAAEAGEGKILYYRNPMGLPDTSPVPKKDHMGMDYIPVYADEGGNDGKGTIALSPEKIQRIGVRTQAVTLKALSGNVQAPGIAAFDEAGMYTVSPRFGGWIEKLHVNTTGSMVKKGTPLMEVYSPELVDAQRDYVVALKLAAGEAGALKPTLDRQVSGALTRLDYLSFPKAARERLQRDGKIQRTVTVYAPASGVVLDKNVTEGAQFEAGAALYRLADTSRIWVESHVPESDLGTVAVDMPAILTFKAFAGKSFTGKVHHIHPELDPATRTATVVLSVDNPDGAIRAGMYADVRFDADATIGAGKVLTVPVGAVISAGSRSVVIVDLGEGRFAPRPVTVGRRGMEDVEIVKGLAENDMVVVRANFLIDAESNLKAALDAFATGQGGAP